MEKNCTICDGSLFSVYEYVVCTFIFLALIGQRSDVVGYPKPRGKTRLFLYPNPTRTRFLVTFVPKNPKPGRGDRLFCYPTT